MNIGDVAKQSGLPAKTIRYYEEIGLVVPSRLANGYRDYCDKDMHRLAFLARARRLGFDIETCRKLLALYSNDSRESADVKAIATEHLAEIEQRIAELKGMASTLQALVDRCHGDGRPDCPIIDDLAKHDI